MTAVQLNRIIDIFDRAVKVAERWADREYPVSDENAEGFISRVGDRPLPQSVEEYKEFEPQPGRFEQSFRNQA